MQTLEQLPLEINQPQTSGLQHISRILPEVLHHIVQAAQEQAQQNSERTEHRSYPLRWAA